MKKNILTKYYSVPGKMGVCLNCSGKNCGQCNMGPIFSKTIHKFASEQLQKISPYKNTMKYIRFRAIGCCEIDSYNQNFDAFPYEEFESSEPGYGYTSFIGKHAFIEHQSDNVEKSIGSLLGAYLNRFDTSKYGNREWKNLTFEERIDILNNRKPEEDGSVEVLMAVDEHLSPSIARMIDTDTEIGCSMGTNIDHSCCSVCGAQARTEQEYCNHVAYSKGSTVLVPANQIRNLIKEGKLRPEWIKWVCKREQDQKEVLSGKSSRMVVATVFEINYGLSFFELSVVANPAYLRGYKLEKIASILKQGFQQLLPLVKVGDEEVELHVDVSNDYFSSSTAKKAKEYNKDFKEWGDLERVEYLRDGEIAKDALKSGQVKKVYVEKEHQSKFEKIGGKFTPMENPTFVELTNPEILLKLTFASKEEFLKFGAFEYKNTGLDLTDVKDFEILISQQGKHPQELVDYMYELAGNDEKKIKDVNEYVRMLQTKYKVIPREYPFKKEMEKEKIYKKIEDKGGESMIEKKPTEKTATAPSFRKGDEVSVKGNMGVIENRHTLDPFLGIYEYLIRFSDGSVDWIDELDITKESSKKTAIYDSLPSTVEDIKDEGIDIEKKEVKEWNKMSEEGDEMIEKEKKTRLPGINFLEDSVSATQVVRDTKKAVQSLKIQVKATLSKLSGELPPGLKEYMEKKREGKPEEHGLEKPIGGDKEKEPEERPMEAKDEEREKKVKELGEKALDEKKPSEKPESVKEVLDNAVKDLKEVHVDLEKIEDRLEGEAEKPLVSVLNGSKRYSRHLRLAVEEVLKDAKPVIEDATEAVEEAEKIVEKTIKDLKTVEKPKEIEEKPKEKDEGGDTVAKKVEDVVASAESIKKASDQLRQMFDKEATSYPPTGARDPGDYGEPPVAKELSTWKEMGSEFEKIKGKEKRTDINEPEGRVDLLTGIIAKLFVNREKVGKSYWLVTKKGSDYAVKATFENVAGEDNLTEDNFKKFCSNSYKLLIMKTLAKKGLEDTRREMFGSWVKLVKKGADYEGRPITTIPKGLYDTDEKDKESGKPRPGVENTKDAPKVAGDKKYYSDAYGDSGFAGDLTKVRVASIVKENFELKRKVEALEKDQILETLAKRAVDLARKAAAVGAIPFDTESVTQKAQEYSELDDKGFKAVEETLDALPTVNAKALTAYQIPEAENVNRGIVYDTTESVRDERIEKKHPDLLKVDNMKTDVESEAKLSKKADIGLTDEEEEIPPVTHTRFEEPYKPDLRVREEEEEEETPGLSADVKDRIKKKASVVPQFSRNTSDLQNTGNVPDFTGRFTTIENEFKRKGINYAPKVKYYNR